MSNLPEQNKTNSGFLAVMSILSGIQVVAGGAVLVDFIPVAVVGLITLIIGGINAGIMYYLNGRIVSLNNVVAYQPNKTTDTRLLAGGASTQHVGEELSLDSPVGYLAGRQVDVSEYPEDR